MSRVRTRWFAAIAAVCAAALALEIVRWFPIEAWLPAAVLMVLTFVSENFAFELPLSGSVSLSFAVIYAAMLHSGPLAAVLCALAASTSVEEFRSRKSLTNQLFNIGQLSLAAGIAGIVYVAAGGTPISRNVAALQGSLPAAAIAAVVFFVINVLLVSLFVCILTQQSLSSVMRNQGFMSYAASLVVLALLGLMIASLLALGSWFGLLLLVLPFMAARRTFRVYVELTEAYTSTVRSLVTAVEAKDPYTRGHSERVAVYARKCAERLGLARADVELLERAALLHDVGKIGIDLDTLTSPTQLSAEEVRIIRQHPAVGSQLVGDVEFLSDIVPIVRHHHERLDGSGYPDGLAGQGIPLLSRILAVADSYDAMTSDRAYRIGMSRESAIQELRRVSGTQLDASAAESFISMLVDEVSEVASQ